MSSTLSSAHGRAAIAERTLRTDRWWLQPAATFGALFLFIVYGVYRSFSNANYYVTEYDYLAPFFSPCLTDACLPEAAHFGTPFPDLGFLVPPPAFVLPFILGFRLTCYYYRKAYYRSFWLSPPACAVAEPHKKYSGETRFPLLGQNLHRFFFYAAFPVAAVLTYDVVIAFKGSDGGVGMGLGTLILLINVVLIWAYTLSCHSCRHLVGGRLKHFSKHPVRYWFWVQVTKLNQKHMQLAWASLISVAAADAYVALVAADVISDLRFFN